MKIKTEMFIAILRFIYFVNCLFNYTHQRLPSSPASTQVHRYFQKQDGFKVNMWRQPRY